jgi:hypothetical protein
MPYDRHESASARIGTSRRIHAEIPSITLRYYDRARFQIGLDGRESITPFIYRVLVLRPSYT